MTGRAIVLRGDAAHLPLPDESVDAVVTDPPYGLEFMGREWDSFKPSKARIRTRTDGRTNPADGKSVVSTPESYTAGRPFQSWCETWAAECLRILKPGGYLLAFGGTRTWHRLVCGIEDAGFEVRDSVADLTGYDAPGLMWVYGSGFPKSLDVSKAIDRRRDDEIGHVCTFLSDAIASGGISRKEIGAHLGINPRGVDLWAPGPNDMSAQARAHIPTWEQWQQLRSLLGFGDEMDAEVWRLNGRKGEPGEAWSGREVVGTGHRIRRESTVQIAGLSNGEYDITAPATEDAARWAGWGTSLKPGWEPVAVGRKPLAGTVAQNVLQFGTGALNIDGCRVAVTDPDYARNAPGDRGQRGQNRAMEFRMTAGHASDVGRWPPNVLLSEEAAAEMDRQSGVSGSNARRDKGRGLGYHGADGERGAWNLGDEGGASRFFPIFRYEAKADSAERPRLPDGTAWPTVKPVALMRWLVRLVTPPGGIVLDPFCGTGTTGEAAVIEGFRAILADRDPQALALARVRLARPVQPTLFGLEAS